MRLHHVSVFVTDMDRTITLFREILGFELSWHIPDAKGEKLSVLLGIQNIRLELAYLKSKNHSFAIELSRLIHPGSDPTGIRFGRAGTSALSMAVPDLDGLHSRMNDAGWTPLSHCLKMRTPEGEVIRAFCIQVEHALTIEFIEQA